MPWVRQALPSSHLVQTYLVPSSPRALTLASSFSNCFALLYIHSRPFASQQQYSCRWFTVLFSLFLTLGLAFNPIVSTQRSFTSRSSRYINTCSSVHSSSSIEGRKRSIVCRIGSAPLGVSALRMVFPRKLLNVTVPSYFMCPISLDLMRDPVTLCTGMTYDRSSIEKWLDDGNLTCPATMQLLDTTSLIPNHTLRRLIQEWCVSNRCNGVERIPTPKLPAQPEEVKAMLEDLKSGINVHDTVKRLRSLARESEKNKRCASDAGAVHVLINLLTMPNTEWPETEYYSADRDWVEFTEDVLATIVLISNIESSRGSVVAGTKQLACICWFLRRGSIESKVNAAVVLESLASNSEFKSALSEMEGVIESLVGLLREKFYPRAVRASLKCLLALCATTRKNRIRAVEAGGVAALVEFLPEAEGRGMLERALKILEFLSSCAEGREAISDHALAIPMLVKLILRASEAAIEHAVVILWMVCEYSVNASTARDSAVQAGVITRLILLLQTECSKRTKQKAIELLKHLRDIWSQYPCSPGNKALSRIAPF